MSNQQPLPNTLIKLTELLRNKELPAWLTNPADRAELDAQLFAIAEELVPDQDRLAHAAAMHRLMAQWLADNDPRIIAFDFQGSVPMGTVIARQRKDEVDLDEYARYKITAHGLSVNAELESLAELLRKLRDRDKNRQGGGPRFDPTDIIVRRRCVTVVFANQFHLDITKGMVPNGRVFPFIDVPERGQFICNWSLSNPEDFIRRFRAKCMPIVPELKRAMLLSEVTIKDLPLDLNGGRRYALQAVVMLLKHARDVHAERNAPKKRKWRDVLMPSVALTTLVMETYRGSPSLSEALIEAMRVLVQYASTDRPGEIINPVMPQEGPDREDLSYRLQTDADAWALCQSWGRSLAATLKEIEHRVSPFGVLRGVMNEDWVKMAEKRHMEHLRQDHRDGLLRTSPTGAIHTTNRADRAVAVAASAAAPLAVPYARHFGGEVVKDQQKAGVPLLPCVQLYSLLRSGYMDVEVDGTRARAWVDRFDRVHWAGRMRPSATSPSYAISVVLEPTGWFTVRCHEKLALADGSKRVPHRYSDDSLCLTHPQFGEWKRDMLLAETVLPWIGWWLRCYETWVRTGEWLGDEHPHLPVLPEQRS